MDTKPNVTTEPDRRERKRVLLLLGWMARQTEAGIVRYAREAGWSLNLQTMRTGALPEPEGIDGVLCLLGGVGSREDMVEFARQVTVPIVDLHSDAAATVPAARVLMNNHKIGRMAADHFHERRFSHCLYACKSLVDHSARDRWHGFSARLKEHGIESDAMECFPGAGGGAEKLSQRQTVERLKSAIGEAEYPLGIFAENDDFAVFVIEACEKLGVRVPEEVALLGCGNHALIVDFSPVALSSIEQNFTDRAYRAAQLLDRLMAGEPAPKQPIVVEPGEVVTRRSTDILAVKDRRVARAVDWIRRNYAEDWLDTPGVAKFCGLSTRTLTRLFNKHLGWSVADEIRQTRIRQACQLLEKTELTFSEIAEKVGFASLQHFRRNFLQTTKISPREWREQRSRPCAL